MVAYSINGFAIQPVFHATDLLKDIAAHITTQVKEALQHPEDFKSCKVLFVTRQGKNYEVQQTVALEHIFS